MKIKLEFTDKEKHVLTRIFGIMLIISNAAVTYFSTEEIEKHAPDYLYVVIGMWMIYAWAYSSFAIFTHYK